MNMQKLYNFLIKEGMIMSDIFKSYLSEEERAIAIEESAYEIQMAKLNAMYEMVDKNLELNMLEAEAKVLTESGTYDDLDYLYEEANKEAAEKKEGIISKIIGVVKQIWQAITNTITNFFSKNKDVEDEVEVDENDEKRMNALNGVWGKIKQLLNFVRNNGGKIAIGVAALGAVVLGGFELFGKEGKKIKKPSSVVKGWIQSIKSKAGEVTSALSSASGDGEEQKKALNILSTVGNKLKKWVTSLTTSLKIISATAKGMYDNRDVIKIKDEIKLANDVKKRRKTDGLEDHFGADRAKKNAKIDKKAAKAIEKMKKSEGKQDNVDENETADKIKEKHSWLADDGEENKKRSKRRSKALSKREELVNKTKEQIKSDREAGVNIRESVEEEFETVLESTDTIFGYDLSNEIEIQENEAYESVMEEIDDLLGDL